MNGWVIFGLVVGYIVTGAAFAVSFIRVMDDKHKVKVDDADSGCISGIALAWPVVLFVLLFALFGRSLIKMSRKGGVK